jgi:hypothetical protein
MSGLLDKANESAKSTENKPEGEVSDAVIDVFPEDSNGSGLNAQKLQFQLGSIAVLIVTMVVVFILDNKAILGEFTLDDLFIPGVLISWLLFNALELKEKEFDMKMLGASAGAILVVSVAFAGLAILSSGTVTISNIEYDTDDNEIDLDFYGPKGMDYTIEILVDGKVEYTHEATINVDKGSHSVDLDDFWKGNAHDMNGKDLVEYEIVVTSKGGEDSMTFDSIMNREVDTAFIKVTEVFETDESGASSNTNGDKTYTGITVQMIVGMGNPDSDYEFEADYFSGTIPQTIVSDWTADVVVKYGSSVKYEYNSINADEGIVNGLGEFSFNWVTLPGTGAGDLERSDFYEEDGCYTFEVTIENENGEIHVDSSSKIKFFWDANEANENDDEDQPASSENC